MDLFSEMGLERLVVDRHFRPRIDGEEILFLLKSHWKEK